MCTGITLKGADGTVVYGRTCEWGAFDLKSKVLIVPRNCEMTGSTPENKPGVQWKSLYGLVGLDALNKPSIIDGINEKGLACGAFYLPGFAEYKTYAPKEAEKSIGELEVVHYILSTCKTVEETHEALKQVNVVPVILKELGFVLPFHYMVTDATGRSIVIEYVNNGELKLYENPLGVITNAPPFDWHLTNLRNYINLSAVAVPPKKLESIQLAPLGAGSGLLGLPGDFTPPSRFVRAIAFTQTARPTKGDLDTVKEVFRILDNFNLGVGLAEGSDIHSIDGDPLLASTQWTTAADTKNLVFYYHTCWNRRLRRIDLKTLDFNMEEVTSIPLDEKREEDLKDITPAQQ